jgi:hypothetical protein
MLLTTVAVLSPGILSLVCHQRNRGSFVFDRAGALSVANQNIKRLTDKTAEFSGGSKEVFLRQIRRKTGSGGSPSTFNVWLRTSVFPASTRLRATISSAFLPFFVRK